MDIWNSGWFEPQEECQGHSCIFQHWKFNVAVALFSLLYIHISCFSSKHIHGNLAEHGPETMLANSVDHHGQSIGQGTAHLHTLSCVCLNVGGTTLCWKYNSNCFTSVQIILNFYP
jgi:hypothetical protein